MSAELNHTSRIAFTRDSMIIHAIRRAQERYGLDLEAADIERLNAQYVESTYDEMILAFSKDVLPNDLIREALPPWPLRLEITPDSEESL